MADERTRLLYKIASSIPNGRSKTQTLLKNYFLMKCTGTAKNLGPLKKQFSPDLRCSYCYNEWGNCNYVTEIKPVKLSKKQRKRMRSNQPSELVKNVSTAKTPHMDRKNQMERICSLCKKITVIPMLKPSTDKTGSNVTLNSNVEMAENNIRKATPKHKQEIKKKPEINVYCNSKDVFCLRNKSNTIASTIKSSLKVIKNNKKKKDKFAGLCREAVLASVKMSKEKQSLNKLHLFLKPSS